MNFKLKQENVYQTRQLNVTNIFPRFSSKNDRRATPASAEFRAKQTKVGCHNLHQLELNTKPT